MTPRILFVCTGNICRSPMAEFLLRDRLRRHRDAASISSAGTGALVGDSAHPETLRVLADRGIDAQTFRATYLTPEVMSGADLVVTMSREHREVATAKAPMRWRRIATLRELDEFVADGGAGVDSLRISGDRNRAELDIADPMGKPGTEFDRLAGELEPLVDRMARWLTA